VRPLASQAVRDVHRQLSKADARRTGALGVSLISLFGNKLAVVDTSGDALAIPLLWYEDHSCPRQDCGHLTTSITRPMTLLSVSARAKTGRRGSAPSPMARAARLLPAC